MMAWPFLVLVMGCQMTMIMYSRLGVLKKDVATKQLVLDDIIEALVQQSLVEGLLQATPAKPLQSLKSSFDRLARSSKASLADESAEKLFQLNVMVIKAMILCCGRPQQLMEMLQKQLSELKTITSLPGLISVISKLKIHVDEVFGPLPLVELHALRRQLCLILQDMKIRISILLTQGIQSRQTGDISVSLSGSEFPNGRQDIGLLHFPTGPTQNCGGVSPCQPAPDKRWPSVLGAYMWDIFDSKKAKSAQSPRKILMLEVSDEQFICQTLGGEEIVLSTREIKKLSELKIQLAKDLKVEENSLVFLRGDGTQLRQFDSDYLVERLKSDFEEIHIDDPAIQAMLKKKVVWLKRDTTELSEAPKKGVAAAPPAEAAQPAEAAEPAEAAQPAQPALPAEAAQPAEAAEAAQPAQPVVEPAPPAEPDHLGVVPGALPKKPASKGARVCALM